MDERDMTGAGRAWMRGELPSADYFAMARRGVRPDVAPGRRLRARLRGWFSFVLRCVAMPYESREGKRRG
jgi:hypothetical protein